MQSLFQQQLATMQALFAQQFRALQGSDAGPAIAIAPAATGSPAAASAPSPATAAALPPARAEDAGAPSRFQAYRAGASGPAAALTPSQQSFIHDLTARYTARTLGSKQLTQDARAVLADPRAAAGFRREWKELVYPIVCARSKGSKIWDVDGNEYIDLVNGYRPDRLRPCA